MQRLGNLIRWFSKHWNKRRTSKRERELVKLLQRERHDNEVTQNWRDAELAKLRNERDSLQETLKEAEDEIANLNELLAFQADISELHHRQLQALIKQSPDTPMPGRAYVENILAQRQNGSPPEGGPAD